uniref:clp protease proteolytic subunit n=1 Tax=Knoxia roxburghii TaxID=1905575 RepID=UPI002E7966D8|nr:clp protease proteolytic subunit [Knoxia roxburghii]WQH63022.1 clp protease proteolytic subunit [Knoxia roxburghii]
MPIGVPKVPFQMRGEEEASWVDVYRLYRDRFLFLCDAVDTLLGNQIMGLMTFLNIEDKTRDQFLFINSPGGWIIPGVGIYDLMQTLPAIVHTICIGVAASMGSFILVGGQSTTRLALPHAWVMIHQPACSFFDGQTSESFLEVNEMVAMRDHIMRVYVHRTGQPFWVVYADMERDVFMSATEAKVYGIVDLVGA